ncbi:MULTISPECIES: hypothetical protein [Isoptericola]|uniref:BON domain-containing protein n=1 Tax=Isoptericola sediminis TaxID=2733572 RepID=A0A849K3Q7_9MICO|nr:MULTISPECIES: hypothetical protein [Isoptericola]MDO8143505.1 hypothetical protein [Isoptericola sp. 178]MDO8147370.1 hypothetical protein [Isoptericola sp. b515]NNU27431.1 hypothetical protein [Isoptericola sediminis]
MATIEQARAAKGALREKVAQVDGVCGVGLAQRGDSHDWVLQVNVTTVRARKDVPPDVEGVPVRVHVVGAVQAL